MKCIRSLYEAAVLEHGRTTPGGYSPILLLKVYFRLNDVGYYLIVLIWQISGWII